MEDGEKHAHKNSPFVFRQSEIRAGGGLHRVIECDTALFADALEGKGALLSLTAEADFSVGSGDLLLEGGIKAAAALPCDRCNADFRASLAESFDEVYEYSVESIDIEDLVRQALVLAVPAKILCSDGCKGLCTRCGADLNAGPCKCGPGRDGPFGALRDLKNKEP